MSFFFGHELELQNEQILATSWSNNEFQPILAVSTNSPRVIFVQEEGTIFPNFEISRGKTAVFMRWHPMFPALAIGYDDGCIMLWNEDPRLTREEKVLHKAPITQIVFSADGTRMVTGDANGTVGVWRTHSGLTPICSYKKEGAITNICFCGLPFDEEQVDKWNSLFFFGGEKGSVFLADDLKNVSEVCKVGGSVKSLLYYEKENSVIIITSHLLLVQFRINLNEKLVPDRKVKLSVAGDPEKLQTVWAGNDLIATASGENMIRLLHLRKDEAYVLTLAEDAFGDLLMRDKIVNMSYNAKRRILACGTKNGFICMWKCKSMSTDSPHESEGWEAKPPFQPKFEATNPTMQNLEWGGSMNIISGSNSGGALILSQTVLQKKMKGQLKLMQFSNKAVEVRMKNEQDPTTDYQIIMTLGMNVKGLDCCKNNCLFWNGKYAQIYEVYGDKNPVMNGTFESTSTVMALHEDRIFQNQKGQIEVLNFQGEIVSQIPLNDSESEIILMDIVGKYMVVVTSNSAIRIYDVSRRNIKQVGMTRKFEQNGEQIGDIKQVSINITGTKIAIIADQSPIPSIKIPDTKFYVYDIELDTFREQEAGEDRIPVDTCWDLEDDRLLCVETEYMKDISKMEDEEEEEEDSEDEDNKVFSGKTADTYFVTSDYGIKNQDSYQFTEGEEAVLGLSVPYIFCLGTKKKSDEDEEEDQDEKHSYSMIRNTMREFSKLEEVDRKTQDAIMNFSFYLTCGNLDEAYNSVRNIQNISVWQAMAQMCVKNKRLDVAQVCLGNMRFSRGAKAAREVEREPEVEAQLAMVAIQLNLIDDAKELYAKCKRNDLLAQMLAAQGDWDEALEVADKRNKINIYYQMANQFERQKEFDKAIMYYIRSETHRVEVPRMLCKNNQFEKLVKFVDQQQDKEIYKWWGTYLESQKHIDHAMEYYKKGEDFGSVVRIHIMKRDLTSAMQVALETQNAQACFHLARALESEGNTREAIQYYSKAKRHHHAVTLAMDQGMDNDVFTIASESGSKKLCLNAARFLMGRHKMEKAVLLFDKGGNSKKAMNIAMQNGMKDIMGQIGKQAMENITDESDIQEGARFFEEHGQYDKAVELKIKAGQIDEALDMAEKFNVNLSDELAQKLIPKSTGDSLKDSIRLQIITRVAEILQRNGSFTLACKLFTQAKQKVKAMQCLLHSADTQKIMAFAQTARNKEVFILAANFLQNSDWHNDPEMMRTIIQFYTKAQAHEQLSGFYDSCAQVEIDEYRDYEKALGAMREALKHLQNSNSASRDQKLDLLNQRIQLVERFVEARNYIQSDPNTMVQICEELLNNDLVDQAIRSGDVFAQLIEFSYEQRNFKQAYDYIERMKGKKIVIFPYLDMEMVENIY